MKFLTSAVIGLIAALLGIEAVLRFLPVNSGIRMEETSAQTPYSRYIPQQPYVYSHGWALNNAREGVTNRQGFPNSRDFADGANALVVGDSFIESFMLDYADTLQGRLDAAIGKTYSTGVSASGLADALQVARHFLPHTRAKAVVLFIEPGDLAAIDVPGGGGHNHFAFAGDTVSVVHTPYVESPLKEPILKSALLRYAYYNLKLPDWLSMQFKKLKGGAAADPDAPARHARQRELALAYLMAELRKLEQQYGTQFIFLVDGDRNAIYTPGKLPPNWGAGEREALLRHANQGGFDVIDMQPLFAAHWSRYRERMDFLPMDGHWNKVAHALAAQQVQQRIAARAEGSR